MTPLTLHKSRRGSRVHFYFQACDINVDSFTLKGKQSVTTVTNSRDCSVEKNKLLFKAVTQTFNTMCQV